MSIKVGQASSYSDQQVLLQLADRRPTRISFRLSIAIYTACMGYSCCFYCRKRSHMKLFLRQRYTQTDRLTDRQTDGQTTD